MTGAHRTSWCRPAVILILLLGGCGPGVQQIEVATNLAWQESGVTVEAGQIVVLEASGRYVFHLDGHDTGPAGIADAEAATGAWPEPTLTGLALLGRVGDAGPPFVVGEGAEIQADTSGTLWFRVNDDIFDENDGALTVVVSIEP